MEPILSGDLCIRPFRKEDADAFVEAALESLSTVGAWMAWCHERFTRADAEGWFALCAREIEAGASFDVGLFSKDGRELLGGVGLNQINRRQNFGNIGYWIRQSRQGRGLATRAALAIAGFGFRTCKLTRLEIVVPERNLPSRRVAEKTGAIFECIARNRVMIHGKPQAAAVYSLIP